MTPTLRPAAFALAVLATLAACVSVRADDDPRRAPVELRQAELGDMSRVAVCGDVWLGQAPTAEHLDIANRRGIRTVISLRQPDAPEDLQVAQGCEGLGMRFAAVGVRADTPTDAEVDRAMAALSDPDRGPALMYCESGARTALVFAIFRATHDAVPLEHALEAARRFGMKPGEPEEVVRRQVNRLIAAEKAGAALRNDA